MGGSDSIYVCFDHFGASAGFFPHYVFFIFYFCKVAWCTLLICKDLVFSDDYHTLVKALYYCGFPFPEEVIQKLGWHLLRWILIYRLDI